MHLWDLLLYVHFLTDSLGFGLWTLLQEMIVFIGHAGFIQCKQFTFGYQVFMQPYSYWWKHQHHAAKL